MGAWYGRMYGCGGRQTVGCMGAGYGRMYGCVGRQDVWVQETVGYVGAGI